MSPIRTVRPDAEEDAFLRAALKQTLQGLKESCVQFHNATPEQREALRATYKRERGFELPVELYDDIASGKKDVQELADFIVARQGEGEGGGR